MKYRRSLFRRRSRRTTHVVWMVVFLTIAGGVFFQRYTQENPEHFQELVYRAGVGLVCLFGVLLVALFFYIKRERRLNSTPGFITQPWEYNNCSILLRAQLYRELPVDTKEQAHRSRVNWFRKLTGHKDQTHRSMHQRFLVTFPGLRKGDKIMVLHNMDFGEIKASPRCWLEIRGVYIHNPPILNRNSFWRRPNFYGQVHYTHSSRGHIKVLPIAPNPKEGYVTILASGRG